MPLNKACTYLQRRDDAVAPIVSFVGTSNSGKTTLLEKIVRELKLEGYRIAVIKHSHHDIEIDQPGKDTWRFAQAGSDIVAISSPNKVAFIEHVVTEPTLEQIKALIGGKVDIILTEGYKNSNTAKILVLGTEQAQEQLCCRGEVLAIISTHWSPLGVPQFDYTDVTDIVNLLIEQISDNSLYQAGKFEELLAESA